MMLLDAESLPLQNYHKAKKLLWDPQEIRYDRDRQDWQTLDRPAQNLIRRALTLFLGGEVHVLRALAPMQIALWQTVDSLEEELFLAAQHFEEAKHVEFFSGVLDEVAGPPEDLAAVAGSSYRTLLEGELRTALDRLLLDTSPLAQAEAITVYHMVVEGVLAETGYYGLFTVLKRDNLLPGLVRGLELVQRDESRHIAFGLHLLSRLGEKDPALWPAVDQRLKALIPLAQGVFPELLREFEPEIPFGLKADDLTAYAAAQYRARLTLLQRARAD